MNKTPNGAMGSPYCSDNGEQGPSVAKLMGDAFERLHENSWDGGKEKQEKRIAKANEAINKKLTDKKEATQLESIETPVEVCGTVSEETIENIESKVIESVKSGTKFVPETKKEMIQMALDNDWDIEKITDEKIVVVKPDGKKFVILPL